MKNDTNSDLCPRCGEPLEFDEVDIGVGIQRGNPGCPNCYWTPDQPKDGINSAAEIANAPAPQEPTR